MAKAETRARLQSAMADLSAALRVLDDVALRRAVRADGTTALDVLNAATGLAEMAGNWHLQSLQGDPQEDFVALVAEAWHFAALRRERAIDACRDDCAAALHNLLTLFDLATESQLAESVLGLPRLARFDALAARLESMASMARGEGR
jgi:hypothetical protein